MAQKSAASISTSRKSKGSKTPAHEGVQRISISLPKSVFRDLDLLISERGFENRSQAISEMITTSLLEHHVDQGGTIMAGTITLFYDQSKGNLLSELATLQRTHIDEVISSLHVLLENNHVMEVILVQGPAHKLKRISDDFITCKGVKAGKLTLTSTIIPPIHPLPKPVKSWNT